MFDIPDLKPGDRWRIPVSLSGTEDKIEIFRANGERVR